MLAEIAGEDVADGVEVGAAMVGHHAFGIACGSGSVTERDGVPFVRRQPCGKTRIALRQRVLIFDLADAPAAREGRIVDIDDERPWPAHQGQRLGDDAGKFRIDQDDFGAAMIELKGNGSGIEPDVERVEHGAGHGHRKMHLVHCRDVRQHRRDRIAAADVPAGEERCKAPAARMGLRPGENAALVNGADMVRIDSSGARQEAQRRQRHIIRRRLVEANAILVKAVLVLDCAHRLCLIHVTYKNPIEIHGKIATTINPMRSASR